MSRPTLEVADILRRSGNSFRERYRSHLAWQHCKVMDAIVRCRTAELGGHRDRCSDCGHTTAVSYNSCRNRHCPKCQGNARARWLAARSAELLPVPYFHIVFTLPHELSALVLQNKRLLYDLLFRASSATLLEVARDPRHLGADIGLLSVLHTWGQTLEHHPHVHCIVPAGGLAPDGRWIASSRRFFLPVRVLSRLFRGKFVAGLKQLSHQNKLQFHGSCTPLVQQKHFRHFLHQLFRKDWVVYAKPPFGGAEHVLHYLARYTHRVAISNHRLVGFDRDHVSFRWKDYAHGSKQKVMTLSADEFLRRFLLHVLPRGLVRIRHFGLFANRTRAAALTRCRSLLGVHPCLELPARAASQLRCPRCSGPMLVVERITAQQLRYALIPIRQLAYALDSS